MKIKVKAEERIWIRCTTKEKNRIKALAEIYCEGSISKWVVHSAINGPRIFMEKKAPLPKKKSPKD